MKLGAAGWPQPVWRWYKIANAAHCLVPGPGPQHPCHSAACVLAFRRRRFTDVPMSGTLKLQHRSVPVRNVSVGSSPARFTA